jgi:alpha-L-rhamnosidase
MNKWAAFFGILPVVLASGCKTVVSDVSVTQLRCEYLINPLGIDTSKPRLSWMLESDKRGQAQKAYRILVASRPDLLNTGNADLWDSGKFESDQSIQVAYAGKDLPSGAQAFWKVKIWDADGAESSWSEPALWTMGLLSPSDWKGKWIAMEQIPDKKTGPPASFFRKTFTLDKPVRKAILSITARGMFEPYLNGERVGKDIFAPEWTDYAIRIQYRTYDVTASLKQGKNAFGAIVGDGWYSGYIGWHKERGNYGFQNSLLLQLVVEYKDSTNILIFSDETWKCSEGPILSSDIMMGETYDARKEITGWNTSDFDDKAWRSVSIVDKPAAVIVAQPSQPVRMSEEVKAISVNEPKPGIFVFDLGQNIAGWARLKTSGPRGTKIVLRFAERLNPDGTIYVANLRGARATDTYITKGGGVEMYEPHFTFHGFQYVEVTGLPSKPDPDTITGCVVYSASPVSGKFECSNDMVNKLYSNITWGQKGNFISIPTDCPQRDERMGWMGDSQIFIRSATYNRDVSAFFTRWMADVEDAQSPEGAYADTSPRLRDLENFDAAPGWGDAGVIIPWTIYRVYNDTRIIERYWASMEKWMSFIIRENTDYIRKNHLNHNYGDWLTTIPQDSTSKVLLATAYWAHDARLMSEMAKVLDRHDDSVKYEALFEKIRTAFQKEFVLPNGKVKGESQTGYVLSIAFELLPRELVTSASQLLVDDIKAKGNHLTTGFIGVRHLCPILTKTGHADVAYILLNNDSYPSWGYSIKHGATTVWERWDGWTAEKGFQNPGMNSFNHYSLGSVCEWLFESVAGIDLDPKIPAYKHTVIRPVIGGGMTFARAEYNSIHGKIASGWKLSGINLELNVTIPVNTTASIYVPADKNTHVTEGGKPAEKAQGMKFAKYENGYSVYKAGSGTYSFKSTLKK